MLGAFLKQLAKTHTIWFSIKLLIQLNHRWVYNQAPHPSSKWDMEPKILGVVKLAMLLQVKQGLWQPLACSATKARWTPPSSPAATSHLSRPRSLRSSLCWTRTTSCRLVRSKSKRRRRHAREPPYRGQMSIRLTRMWLIIKTSNSCPIKVSAKSHPIQWLRYCIAKLELRLWRKLHQLSKEPRSKKEKSLTK